MRNFPIYEQYRFTDEELLRYLAIFPVHSLEVLNRFNNTLLTTHLYEDGLLIRASWDRTKTISVSTDDNFNKFLEHMHLNEITPIAVKIAKYSNDLLPPISEDIILLFKSNFPDKCNFSESLYQELELGVKRKTTIPDFFFDDLIHTIQLHLLFNQYYDERNKK